MRRRVVLLLVTVFLSSVAFAADPPGRVARLNYIGGQVSIQPGGVNDWVAGTINRPLTSSDRVWTDRNSRAELQLGAASVRLNDETSLTFANVSDNAIQLQLDQGTLNLHVMKLFDGEVYEIDTPNLAFTVEKSGDYRFDVDNAGDTTVVTVWNGKGVATGDSPGIKISKGQQFTFRSGRSLNYAMTNAPGFDGFDSWCQVRAQREDKSPSLQYVSPYAVGYSDLDEYGRWQTLAPYGPVWIPATVAVGWAPYRWGHWVFIAPWGWTWVDDAPWGFAPYHYGRWVNFGAYWGWCPGPYHPRPIWAPALVGWIGGAHWGIGLSFGIGGGVGWFPLGWGEPYIPYYNHSRGYYQNVNVTNTYIKNVTVINNYYGGHNVNNIHYINMHTPQAITAVSNATFAGSRPTRSAVIPVSSQALNGATPISAIPVRPTRESMVGPIQHTPAPPPASFNRPVVTRMTPPTTAASSATTSVEPGRPSRGTPGGEVTNAPVVSSTEPVRPSRSIPHPPETSASKPVTTNSVESMRHIEHSPESQRQLTVDSSVMPSRVPRPSPTSSMTQPSITASPTYEPSRVPRPTTAVANDPAPSSTTNIGQRPTRGTVNTDVPHPTAPITTTPAVIDRPTRGATTEIPHPTYTPTPSPSQNMNRESRPAVNETHNNPPPTTSAPQHTTPPSAPPPSSSQPSRPSRPESKSDTPNKSQSQANYPRPYGPTVRPASFENSSTARPASEVMAAPASYRQSASAPRPATTYHAPAVSHSSPSHVPTHSAPHASSSASIAHSSVSSPQRAARSSVPSVHTK